jgi:hypothetical protein
VLVVVVTSAAVVKAVTRPITMTTKLRNISEKINFSFFYTELFTLFHYFQMTV